MILVTITTDPNDHPERLRSFIYGKIKEPDIYVNSPNIGVVPAMQVLFERNQNEDIICFAHNDVTCHDASWNNRVMAEFDDPKVAIVGFGGASGIGVDDIYKRRYEISQLQRIGYASNQRDWEVHGTHETGSKNVAVLDGFFMAVRTSFLKEIGGFKWFPHLFHGYDTCLCLMAHRHGYKVRMVGIDCTHHGASHSASPEYKKWCLENGTTMEREHYEPHNWMYNEFRDLLPFRITEEERKESPLSVDYRHKTYSVKIAPESTTFVSGVADEERKEAPSAMDIVQERMDRFLADPANYNGPFSGITYGDVVTPNKGKHSGKCNIVMVTNGGRPRLYHQALESLEKNTKNYTLTLVGDNFYPEAYEPHKDGRSIISVTPSCRVLSRLKNLGVYWSEKQFGRGDYLCIVDDDVAFFPGWLDKMANQLPSVVLLGSVRHPYHQPNNVTGVINELAKEWQSHVQETDAIAGYCHFMEWETWDDFGPYEGTGEGIGKSEDYAFSRKIVESGYRVGYIHPPVMAHCGITNSLGQPATGAEHFERVKGILYE